MLPSSSQDLAKSGKTIRDYLSSFKSQSVESESPRNSGSEFIRRNFLPRDGYGFMKKIVPESIFDATQHHVSYKWNLTTLKGLDKYNDCAPYGITEKWERKLLQEEVNRLVKDATSDTPLLFNSSGRLSPSTNTAFAEVSHIADQIRCAMGIIRLDNARIAIEHCTVELNETTHAFRQARRRLMGRFNTDQGRVQGSAPIQLEPPERNKLLYHALVDFITSSVARLLVRTAASEYWSQQVLSSLAAATVKLKVLAKNTEKFANESIATAEAALESINQSNISKGDFLIKIRPNPDDDAKDIDIVDTETDTSRHYYMEKTLFNKEIFWLIRRVLHNVLVKESQISSASSFEIHTTVYKAGLDGLPTVLTSDRLGEVSVSSDFFVVKNSYTALRMVAESLKAITHNRPHHPPRKVDSANYDIDQSKKTAIACEWTDPDKSNERLKSPFETENVDEVFSVVIPMSLSTAWIARGLAQLICSAAVGTGEQDPVLQFEQPPRDFEAHFTVITADWKEKERQISQQEYKDEEVTTLPQNPIRLGFRAGTTNFATTYDAKYRSSDKAAQAANDYQRDKAAMGRWVISEDSITIQCRGYVFFVMSIATIVVFGGIAIPFVVGQRITGVDPFQITVFLWVVAGVIILAAKGKYVSEWPWHEFIHGHVICRTIRETCEASGIGSQTIIMYLLLNEWNTILRTRGPYNGMFSRRITDGGFSINEPLHTSTMMSSGFVILKVLNAFGEYLICLDARRGTEFVALSNVSNKLASERLEDYDNVQTTHVKRLTRMGLHVDRILGIYTGDSYFG